MAHEFVGTDTAWDELVLQAARIAHVSAPFTQGAVWALVAHERHHPCARVLDSHGNPSLWILLEIKPWWRVWFCPKGPVVLPPEQEWDEIIEVLQQRSHATLVRIEPLSNVPPRRFFKRKDVSPSCTLLTPLQRSDNELFNSFHEKTRYNIRVSERAAVQVKKLEVPEAIARTPEILSLYDETALRHDIGRVSDAELRSLFSFAEVWAACVDDRMIATSLEMRYADTLTYVHGASRHADRASMGTYALHWAIMRAARDAACTQYDWWGVAPEGAGEQHPLAGVTRFKIRFGGTRVLTSGTFDRPVDRARYALYTAATRLRNKF